MAAEDVRKHVQDLLSRRTYGGHEELFAIANILQVRICILTRDAEQPNPDLYIFRPLATDGSDGSGNGTADVYLLQSGAVGANELQHGHFDVLLPRPGRSREESFKAFLALMAANTAAVLSRKGLGSGSVSAGTGTDSEQVSDSDVISSDTDSDGFTVVRGRARGRKARNAGDATRFASKASCSLY